MGVSNAHIDPTTGDLVPDSLGYAWSDLTTWAAWTRWDMNPSPSIVYTRTLDAGGVYQLIPACAVQSEGSSTVEVRSSEDGTSWSAWGAPGALLTTRFVEFRVTVTGDYPTLVDVEMSLLTEKKEQVFDDLSTAGIPAPWRIGVGDVRLPLAAGFSVVTGVVVSFVGTGAGWTAETVDKDPVLGPRIRIYNAAGALADAVIDAIVKGA